MKGVLICGLGNFGYAILKHLDRYKRSEYRIYAFDRNPKVMSQLRNFRRHLRIKPNQKISKDIILPTNLAEVFPNIDILILAITASSIPEVLKQLNDLPRKRKKLLIINTAKALAPKTGERLDKIIAEQLIHPHTYVYIAGGTIAEDLYNSHPLGATVASINLHACKQAEHLLGSRNFRLYSTRDVAGTEYCAAFKNVVSIFAGIVSGLGWPYGSETYFISRFSKEVERFVHTELKGELKTFSMDSQCWGNDLWMSCTGKTRNREFGYLIGRGLSVEQAILKMQKRKKSVEGLTTIQVLPKLVKNFSAYPFLQVMKQIILENKDPETSISLLIENKII